jgi:hypothetical protein
MEEWGEMSLQEADVILDEHHKPDLTWAPSHLI